MRPIHDHHPSALACWAFLKTWYPRETDLCDHERHLRDLGLGDDEVARDMRDLREAERRRPSADWTMRKDHIIATVQSLERRGRDAGAIYDALKRATHDARAHQIHRSQNESAREVLDDQKRVLKRIDAALKAVEKYFRNADGDTRARGFIDSLRRLRRHAETSPFREDGQPETRTFRLPRRGRPAAWLHETRARLTRLRVPRADQTELFKALGMVPDQWSAKVISPPKIN